MEICLDKRLALGLQVGTITISIGERDNDIWLKLEWKDWTVVDFIFLMFLPYT